MDNNIANSSTVKTPEAESETPTRIQPVPVPVPTSNKTQQQSFTNGVLKRHPPLHVHHHHPIVLSYKECLKNHAATMGGHALDGCGEFMPSPTTNPSDPTSLKCAACGCHRNFHRREPEDPSHQIITQSPAIEFQPLHRTHPPNPPPLGSPDESPSPPPISSAYYPSSAPHMLLALSHGAAEGNSNSPVLTSPVLTAPVSALFHHNNGSSSSSRKRFRTKFTQNQKDKMLELAEKVGWKMQKRDEEVIGEFCGEIGVDKSVFKVWMHNNKNTFGKKEQQLQFSADANIAISTPPPVVAGNGNGGVNGLESGGGGAVHLGGGANGGSSSSS